ncbi:22714_t:CDS:1, partial [Gigaspora margarita]
MSSQNYSEPSTTFSSGVSNFTKWIKGQLSRSDTSKEPSKEQSTKYSFKKTISTKVFSSSSLSKLEKRLKRSKSLTSSSSVLSKNNTTTPSNVKKKKRPNSVCAEPNYWVNDEILENADLLQSTFFSESDIYELS